jgi:hypothetical protein
MTLLMDRVSDGSRDFDFTQRIYSRGASESDQRFDMIRMDPMNIIFPP